VRLDVAGGDDESVDGGEEGNCRRFLRELYVRWTLEDIKFDAREVVAGCGNAGGILRRRDASLWLCLQLLCMESFETFFRGDNGYY
jgi:hypothetical protein